MEQRLGVGLCGSGSGLPSRIVNNADFAATIDSSDEWIRSRTGIRQRRFADAHETSSTLGTQAARLALEQAGLEPADLDLIICATVTPDFMCPSTACLIQAALGCRSIPAFDLNAACSGFLYALASGTSFIRSGMARNVLVVGADILSRAVDFSDRNTCVLFGDGAGAVILKQLENGQNGFHRLQLYSDGRHQELIQVPSMVTPNPPPGATSLPQLRAVRMNGREVFKFAVHRLIELIEQAQLDCVAIGQELSLVVPHQVNERIIDAALRALDFPAERVMMNLQKYGNTSAASVPIALDEAIRTGKALPGQTILLAAFGGGLTWSSALVTLT
jgi:3-oxoacyl-[acyl-carrier-protein] synthase-3